MKFAVEMRSSNGTNDIQINGTTTVSLNTWYHVAVVRTGTTVYLFVNGAQDGTAGSMNQNIASASAFNIGAYNNGVSDWWGGFITNLRVVKGTALYTANFTPSSVPLTNITNTSLLLAVLSSGAATIDISSNAFTVTNNGTVTYSSTVTPYPFY